MLPALQTLKTVGLALSLIIVLNLFFHFGVQTFYPQPEQENFCPQERVGRTYADRAACEEVGGRWFEQYPKEVPRHVPDGELVLSGYCDAFYTCNQEYQGVREVYDRNVFVILVLAGLAAFGIGYFIHSAEAVSLGLLLGGVLSFIIGTIQYWSRMHDYLRFGILTLVLAVLLWVGYTKLRRGSSIPHSL
ncbi:MAG: hypothetical protein U1A16_04225 [Patescibacteria group bacterium]|nr:hypothetical protein [Patescibacteria group bacterium]